MSEAFVNLPLVRVTAAVCGRQRVERLAPLLPEQIAIERGVVTPHVNGEGRVAQAER